MHKLAARVAETGEPETIRKELNPFARRFVHLAIQDGYPQLKTESVGDDLFKKVCISRNGEGASEHEAPSED